MATTFQVRTDPDQPDAGANVLLDWFADDKHASTVQYGADFLKGLAPTPIARDLLHLGGAVYCADKVALRSETPDYWTRELALQLPVSDVARWNSVRDTLIKALSFLSGDHWDLTFVQDEAPAGDGATVDAHYDAVSLFSGGLDSLAGVIDRLEARDRLLLVGHHDSPFTDHAQSALFDELKAHYGADHVVRRPLWLRPAPRRAEQRRPLPAGDGENTTRSRSMLFLAAGVAVADAVGPDVPLYVPENGFIGINVPLTAARTGSLSTRTTHPLFIHRMLLVLDGLGLRHELRNPYRLLTKGEALEASPNRQLLTRLGPRSVSCSHPEAPRWRERGQGNCGYCYPCLIRRASMHHIGEDRAHEYQWDALTDTELLARHIKSGRSLRALLSSLNRAERSIDVIENGRIPGGETEAFFELYRRGRGELRTWLAAGAGPELRRRLR